MNAATFALLGALALAITLYWAGPGFMAIDSGAQLEQARSFAFRDDHPVLMALIWHYTDLVLPGPFGLMLLMNAAYWFGLAGIFAAMPGPLLPRALAFVAIAVHPPSLSNMLAVWKDTLMQGAMVAGIACVASPGWRFWGARLALASVLFVTAIGARHNAAAAVWPFVALPLLGLPWLTRYGLPWRWLAAVSVGIGITLALTLALGKSLAPLAKRTEFWQMVPVFDLAGMSVATQEVLVEPESGVLTRGMGLREIASKYRPEWVNSLYYCLPFRGKRCVPLFRRVLDPDKLARLVQNWRRAIVAHPGAYLTHRLKVSEGVLGLAGKRAPSLFFVDRSPHTHFALDYPLPRRAERLLGWFDRRVSTFWFSPSLYVGLCLALLPIAIWRHARGSSALPVMLALSGLSYALGLLITAGSADYRYTVWATLCSMLCLATLALQALAEAQRKSSARRLDLAEPAS